MTGGSATFEQNGGNWTINTQSNKTVIKWQSFGVPAGTVTQFNQPGKHSAVLNKVTGPMPTGIYGALLSNGKVYVINPNGIVVGPSGVIKTSGFVGSTLNIDDGEFLAGGTIRFSGTSTATVVNLGQIDVNGGDVLLVAPQVENHGTISADGTVALVAAQDMLLTADHQIFIQPTEGEIGGTGVLNTGAIQAARAELRAQGNLYALAINNEGTINANSVVEEGGRILLRADGGTVQNSGTLSAQTGEEGATKGGVIDILGETVILDGYAVVDVSGDLGGGQIHVGGNYQGNGPLPNAQNVMVTEGVEINASALGIGNGGEVIIWADNETIFNGTILAMGGQLGGDGGFVETSGKINLWIDSGFVNTLAPNGQVGTWLLDPNDIVVDNAGAGTIPQNFGGGGTVNINATTINNAASTVILHADNTIQVNADIVMVNNGVGIDFGAGKSITVNNSITTKGGNLIFSANDAGGSDDGTGGITINAALDTTGAGQTGGTIVLNNNGGSNPITLGASLTTDNGAVTITGNTVLADSVFIQTNGGAVGFSGSVNATTAGTEGLTVDAVTGAVTFGGVVGTTALATLDATGATINLANSVTTSGTQDYNGAVVLTGSATLTTTGSNVTFTSTVDSTGGGQGLIVAAGTGTVDFQGLVGDTNALSSLNVTGASILLGDNVTTSGTQTYLGDVALDGNLTTTNGNVSITGDVLLAQSVLIDTGAGAGDVLITGTTDATAAGTEGLSITAGTGTITLGNTGTGTALGSLVFNSGGALTLNGSVFLDGGSGLDFTNVASVALGGNVTLDTDGAGAGANAGGVTFGGTAVNGGFDLTIDTTVDDVGDTAGAVNLDDVGDSTELTALSVSGGALTLNGDISITGGNDLNFSGVSSVTLGGDVILDTDAAGAGTDAGNVTFGSNAVNGGFSLTIDATADDVGDADGDLTLGIIGDSTALSALSVSGGALTLNGNISITGGSDLDFSGVSSITLGGNVTLDTDAAGAGADAGNVTFGTNAVNGGFSLAIDATADDAGDADGSVTLAEIGTGTALSSLTVSGDAINLGGDVTTTGTQDYTGDITLTAGVALNTTDSDVNVTGTIDGGQTFSVNAGLGEVDLVGDIGGGTALTSVSLTGSTIVIDSVTTTGTQIYTGDIELYGANLSTTDSTVTLDGNVVLFNDVTISTNTGAGDIVVTGTLDSDSLTESLIVNAGTGAVNFQDDVGPSLDLLNFTVTGATINLQTVFTEGDQTFTATTTTLNNDLDSLNGAITINGNTVLATGDINVASGGGTGDDVTFGGTVTGAQNLLVTGGTDGKVNFQGVVSGLVSLDATGAEINLAGDVTTTGGQTYTGAVTVNSDAVFTTTAAGTIAFNSTLNSFDGTQTLTVDAGGGSMTFGAAVGGSSDFASIDLLSTNATALTLNQSFTTSGTMTISSTSGASQASGVITADTLDLDRNGGAGDWTFNQTNMIANLTADADGNIQITNGTALALGAIDTTGGGGTGALTVNHGGFTLDIDGPVTLGGGFSEAGGGGVNLNGTLSVGANSNISFASTLTVSGAAALSTSGTGMVTLATVNATAGTDTLAVTAGTGGIQLNGDVGSGATSFANVLLNSGAGVNQTAGRIFAGTLQLEGTGPFVLNTTLDNLNSNSTSIAGLVTINNDQALTINSGTGLSASGNILLNIGGDLTIDQALTSTAGSITGTGDEVIVNAAVNAGTTVALTATTSDITVDGAISTTAGGITLDSNAGALAINQDITAGGVGSVVVLDAASGASGAGQVTGDQLLMLGGGAFDLSTTVGTVASGALTAGSSVTLTNDQTLTVGAVLGNMGLDADSGISLTTTGAASNLNLNEKLDAGAGDIDLTWGGVLTTAPPAVLTGDTLTLEGPISPALTLVLDNINSVQTAGAGLTGPGAQITLNTPNPLTIGAFDANNNTVVVNNGAVLSLGGAIMTGTAGAGTGFVQNGPGPVNVAADTLITVTGATGTIDFNAPVTLNGNLTLVTNATSGQVDLMNVIEGAASPTHTLSITAGNSTTGQIGAPGAAIDTFILTTNNVLNFTGTGVFADSIDITALAGLTIGNALAGKNITLTTDNALAINVALTALDGGAGVLTLEAESITQTLGAILTADTLALTSRGTGGNFVLDTEINMVDTLTTTNLIDGGLAFRNGKSLILDDVQVNANATIFAQGLGASLTGAAGTDLTADSASLNADSGGIDLDTDIGTGLFNANAVGAGAITIRETNGLNVGVVTTLTGTVTLNLAAGAITDGNGALVNIVTTGLADLTAPGGINLDTDIGQLTASATNNAITIREADSLALNLVSAGNGIISLTAGPGGSLTDNNAGAVNLATSGAVTLFADGGINLDTDIGALTATSAGAADITIREVSGLTVNAVTTGSGDITLDLAAGAITDGNAGLVNLSTTGDAILSADGGINLDTTVGSVNAAATGASAIVIRETGVLSVDSITAGTGTITLSGTQVQNAAPGVAITSTGTLVVTGVSGINLETSVAALTASTTDSAVSVTNTGALQVNTVTAGTGSVTLSATQLTDGNAGAVNIAGGNTVLTGTNGIDLDLNLNAAADTVTASATDASINLSEVDTLVLNNVNAGTGDVTLSMGAGVTQNAGTSITADTLILSGAGLFSLINNNNVGALQTSGALGGGLNFTNSGALIINNVNVGANAVNITLAAGGLTEDGDGAVDLTAGAVNLTAPGGIDLDTSITSLTALATGASNIAVRESNGLTINTVDAGTGTVTLTLSAGALADGNAPGVNNISATTANLTGPGGIDLDTDVGTLNASSTNNNITIREANTLTVGAVNAGAGDVSLTAAGNLADGNGAAANVTGNAVTLTSAGGVIDLDLSANVLTASTNNLAINISNNQALLLNTVNAGTGTVTLVTTAGALGDNNGAGNNITGNAANLTGAGGIDVDTTVATLTAASTDSNINVSNAGDLSVVTVNAGAGDVTLAASQLTDGNGAGTNITGNAANLTGTTGIDLDTAVNSVTALATDSAIILDNTGTLAVNTVNAGTGTLNLTATQLTDGNGAGVNIQAGNTVLTGTTGIDLDLNLNAATSTVTASATDAAINLSEADTLVIAGINAGTGDVTLNMASGVTQTGGITGGTLTLGGAGIFDLTGVTNSVSALAAPTLAGDIMLLNNQNLALNNINTTTALPTFNGDLWVDVGANTLTINGPVNLDGTFTGTSNLTILAGTLQVGTNNSLIFGGTLQISGNAALAVTGSGAITVGNVVVTTPGTDSLTLTTGTGLITINGNLGTGANSLDTVTLNGGGGVDQNGGTIFADTLVWLNTGMTGGTTTLSTSINNLNSNGTIVNGDVSVTNNKALTVDAGLLVTGLIDLNTSTGNIVVDAAITSGLGNVLLDTGNGAIVLNQNVTANGLVELDATTGASGAGLVTGGSLSLLGGGTFDLDTSVDNLSSGNLGATGQILVSNNKTLVVNNLTAGNGIDLTTTAGNLTIAGAVNAGTNTIGLHWAGALSQPTGSFSANTLTLEGANTAGTSLNVTGVTNLGTTGGGITGTGEVSITSTNALAFNTFNVNGNDLTLRGNGITTNGAFLITADAVQMNSFGAVNVNTSINGVAINSTGPVTLVNDQALAVNSITTALNGAINGITGNGIDLTTTAGGITLNSILNAAGNTIALDSAAGVNQSAGPGNAVTASVLQVSGTGDFLLLNPDNAVATLTTGAGGNVNNGQIYYVTSGAVTLGEITTLGTPGDLSIEHDGLLTTTGPISITGSFFEGGVGAGPGGGVSLGGAITAAAGQSLVYNSVVSLGSDAILTVSGAGSITLGGALGNGNSLTLNIGDSGTLTVGGPLGTAGSQLNNLTVNSANAAGVDLNFDVFATGTVQVATLGTIQHTAGTIHAGTGVSFLPTAGGVTQTGGILDTALLGLNGAGTFTIDNVANLFTGLSTLGGSVGGDVTLVSLGVVNVGDFDAGTNDVSLASAGATSSGTLTADALSVNGTGNFVLGTSINTLNGNVSGNLVVTENNALNVNGGTLSAGGNLNLTTLAGDLTITQSVSSGGTTNLNSAGALAVNALVDATGNASLTSAGNLTTTATVQSGGSATLNSTGGNVSLGGPVTAAGLVDVDANGTLGTTAAIQSTGGSVDLDAGGNVTVGNTLAATGTTSVNSAAGSVAVNGAVSGNNGVTVGASTSLTSNAAGDISSSAGNVVLGAGTTATLDGTVLAGGSAQINSNGNLDVNDTVNAAGTAILTSTGGSVSIDGAVTGSSVNANAQTTLTTSALVTSNTGNVSLSTTAGDLDINAGVNSAQNAILNAGSNLSIDGSVLAANVVDLDAGGGITTTQSITSTAGNTTMNAGTGITLGAGLSAGNDALLTAGGNIAINQVLGAGGDVVLTSTGGSISLTNAVTAANAANLQAQTGILLNQNLNAGTTATLNSAGGTVTGTGTVNATSLVVLGSATLYDLNTNVNSLSGTVTGGPNVLIDNGATGLMVGALSNAGGLVDLTAGGIVMLGAGNINANSLALHGTGVFSVNGTVTSFAANLTGLLEYSNNGALIIGNVNGVDGVTTNGSGAKINASGLLTLNSGINVGGANVMLNTSGATQAGGAINAAGLLLAGNGTFTLNQATNNIGALAGSVNGPLTFTTQTGLTVGGLTIVTPDGPLSTLGLNSNNSNITLNTGGALNINAPLLAGNALLTLNSGNDGGAVQSLPGIVGANQLLVTGTGTYNLNNPDNLIQVVAADFDNGSLDLFVAGDITVATIGAISGITAQSGNVSITAPNGFIKLDASITATPGNGGTASVQGDVRPNPPPGALLNGSGSITLKAKDTGSGGPVIIELGNTDAAPPPVNIDTGDLTDNLVPIDNFVLDDLGGDDLWELKWPKELVKAQATLDEIFKQGFNDQFLIVTSQEVKKSLEAVAMADKALAAASPLYHAMSEDDELKERLRQLLIELKEMKREVRRSNFLLAKLLKRLYLEKKRERINQDAFKGAIENLRRANEDLRLITPMTLAAVQRLTDAPPDLPRDALKEEVFHGISEAESVTRKALLEERYRQDRLYNDILRFNWTD